MQAIRDFYQGRVFPWLNDKLNADPALQQIRADALQAARGEVLEIGFGTGLNLPLYPPAVTRLVAVEPNAGMIDRAAPRIRDATFPVEVIEAGAEKLLLPDRSFDTAVSVLTLCTVSDPASVVAELHRVLRDGGRLLLMEHGLADDPGVARWQNRLDRLQSIVACGCHLNRPVAALVTARGFRFGAVRRFYAPGIPRTHGWLTVGVALKV